MKSVNRYKRAPKIIYLQWKEEEVTWCKDKIYEEDVPYHRIVWNRASKRLPRANQIVLMKMANGEYITGISMVTVEMEFICWKLFDSKQIITNRERVDKWTYIIEC